MREAVWLRSHDLFDMTFPRVCIDDSLIGDDKEVLEDLVAAAVNDAVRRVEKKPVRRKWGA
ncbi:MAG: hypothetical protein CM1200mP41_25860 [Gammaproteobacteria bacterium]|nr:MAG: hypothetical protein CM1200mP41_25860 [Gammaproteobacteria bacterium]